MRPKQEKEVVKQTVMFTPKARSNLELLSKAEGQDMSMFLSTLLTSGKYQLLSDMLGFKGLTTEPISDLLECYINHSCGNLAADKGEHLMELMSKLIPDMIFDTGRITRYQHYIITKYGEVRAANGKEAELTGFEKTDEMIQNGTFASNEGLSAFIEGCRDNMWRSEIYEKAAPFRLLKIAVDVAVWKNGRNCTEWYPEIKKVIDYLL